jgi:hypothetical protein
MNFNYYKFLKFNRQYCYCVICRILLNIEKKLPKLRKSDWRILNEKLLIIIFVVSTKRKRIVIIGSYRKNPFIIEKKCYRTLNRIN